MKNLIFFSMQICRGTPIPGHSGSLLLPFCNSVKSVKKLYLFKFSIFSNFHKNHVLIQINHPNL